jgi:hypothetical protein
VWYVGSGTIESTNKTVLQRRLRQAGMRWNRESGQFILSLMSKALSNLWDEQVVKPIRNLYVNEGVANFLSFFFLYELLFHNKVNSLKSDKFKVNKGNIFRYTRWIPTP